MKKIISLLLSFCIISAAFSVYAVDYGKELQNSPQKTYTQKFSDVPNNYWAFEYIGEMAERNVISGYPDGKFYPDDRVTRAEFAKIMTTAAGVSISNSTQKVFADVSPNEWYAPYVNAAKDYLSAYSQNGALYYLPNTPALREDIAVALVKLKGYSTEGADLSAIKRMFKDYQSISENAMIYVATAIENGLISGYDDGTFKGQNSITRAEAATLLWRAYQYGNVNKTYDYTSDNTAKTNKNTNNNTNNNTNKSSDNLSSNDDIVEEVKKPYAIKKLASANLEDLSLATIDDNNNIYYIDSSDNCVYKISVSNGNKTKYFDPNKLSYEKTEKQENDIAEEVTKTVETGEYEEKEEEITETIIDEETGEEKEVTKTVTKQIPITKEVKQYEIKTVTEEVTVASYSSFVPEQVFYDSINGKLLLNGYYENLVEAGKSPENGNKYQFIYDISDKKDKLLCIPFPENCYTFLPIYVIIDNSYLSIGSNPSYEVNITDNSSKKIWMRFGVKGIKYGNDLYGYYNGIEKYDFNNDDYTEISDRINCKSVGQKDGFYYFWVYDGSIIKISVRNLATTVLDINTKSENVDFEDMGNMYNIDEVFLVADDNTIIFYDKSMKAFRILEKN